MPAGCRFFVARIRAAEGEVFEVLGGDAGGDERVLRIRGWEIDAVEFKRKSYGQSYALGKKSSDPEYLSSLLMKLTEKMARRLRRALKTARGIHVACGYIVTGLVALIKNIVSTFLRQTLRRFAKIEERVQGRGKSDSEMA